MFLSIALPVGVESFQLLPLGTFIHFLRVSTFSVHESFVAGLYMLDSSRVVTVC